MACRLHGPVVVAGLDAARRRVTTAVRLTIAPGQPALTRGGMQPGRHGRTPAGELSASLLLEAAGTHHPGNSAWSCHGHQVDPAAFTITRYVLRGRSRGRGHFRSPGPLRRCAVNRGLRASTAAVGVIFGFLITASGFGNYTTIRQALLFRRWYLFAVFGSAMMVAAIGLALLRRAGTTRFGGPLRLPHRPVQPHRLCGAAIFGAGFGLAGTCPGGAIAMAAIGGAGGCWSWPAWPPECGCAA